MIPVQGQLSITTRRGMNGTFNIGWLKTSFGEFYVKEKELEQYKEGRYEGEFIITNIDICTYSKGSRAYTDIRASLGGMTLSKMDRLSREESKRLAPKEVDPVEEETRHIATPPVVSDDPLVDTRQFEFAVRDDLDGDAGLFGTLYPLQPSLMLDKTVDRQLLRQQKQRLEELGYRFDYQTQVWSLPEEQV